MAERKSYVPGTPSWVDLGTADTEAAARFYGELLGWSAVFDPRPEAAGYGMFTLRGRTVAGTGPQASPGPPYWAVYVSVADVDETAAKITQNGGKLLAGPMDVFTAGRMAVAQDRAGTDLAGTRDFYGSVFGWGTQSEDGGDHAAIFTVEDNVVCGAHAANPGEPPAWVVWFAVEDCDASTAQASALGGTVHMPPMDMGFGRGAVLADPQGAVFGIGAVNPTTPGYSG